MKRFALIIAVLIAASGCAAPAASTIDPAIQPHVDQFVKAAQYAGVSVSIEGLKVRFGELHDPAFGANCITFRVPHRYPEVVVVKAKWDTLSTLEKDVVIMHELGHCILDRDHISRSSAAITSAPLSLMNYRVLKVEQLLISPAHYAWELFHPGDDTQW